MKKLLLLTLTILSVLNINAKGSAKLEISMIQPIAADNWNFERDSINVVMGFYTRAGLPISIDNSTACANGEFGFQLENKTNHRIYIEWDNARLCGSRPIFGTDNLVKIKTNGKKEDESVPATSKSMLQQLYVEREPNFVEEGLGMSLNIGSHVRSPWNSYELKRKGTATFDFILPIKYEKGKTEDIKFQLKLTWTNTSDLSLIKAGMKDKEVKKLIGSPESKTKDKDNDIEIWHYTNNGDITLVDDKVTEINKK